MTFQSKLVQMGEWSASAKLMCGGELDAGVSLTGSTGTNGTSTGSCVNAYQITKDITFVTAATSNTAGNAAILPQYGSGFCTIFNNSAFTMYVFAPVGGTINNYATTGITTNVGTTFAGCFQIASNKSACFMSADGVAWYAQHAG
jgi:hypothetical protein